MLQIKKVLSQFLFTFVTIITLSALSSKAVTASPCWKFVIANGHGLNTKMADGLTQIFKSYGVCIDVTVLPSKRATHSFLAGKFDGEIGRIKFYENVVKSKAKIVPTPLFHYSGLFVSRNSEYNSIESIKNKNVKIGRVRGEYWQKIAIKKFGFTDAFLVNTNKDLLEGFKRGRISSMLVPSVLKSVLDYKFEYTSVPLMKLTIHIWIHKDSKLKVSAIDGVLKSAIKKGDTFLK